jgi:hypothetical protein
MDFVISDKAPNVLTPKFLDIEFDKSSICWISCFSLVADLICSFIA